MDKEVLVTLQSISDTDPHANLVAQQIDDLPDITEEEIAAQWEEHEKSLIKLHPLGYQGWIKERKKWPKTDKKAYKINLQRWKRLKKWAKENGCYNERSSTLSRE